MQTVCLHIAKGHLLQSERMLFKRPFAAFGNANGYLSEIPEYVIDANMQATTATMVKNKAKTEAVIALRFGFNWRLRIIRCPACAGHVRSKVVSEGYYELVTLVVHAYGAAGAGFALAALTG